MKIIYTLLFLSLTICILTNSELSLAYALLGLNLWFEKMIPALLPFMILSGIMVRMNLTQNFSKILYPLVKPIFRVSPNTCYAMIMGFLCGFPMGAKTVSDLLKRGMITDREAKFLLAFCNNIGPVYFCSFVLPLLGRELVLPYVCGMYGIPLLYGLFLRYTKYARISLDSSRHLPSDNSHISLHLSHPSSCRVRAKRSKLSPYITKHSKSNNAEILACTLSTCNKNTIFTYQNQNRKNQKQKHSKQIGSTEKIPTNTGTNLLNEIDDAITSSVQSILSLGGYMILFSLLNLPFHILCEKTPIYLAPLFEITGGLKLSGGHLPLYALLLLPFGGLSCIAQTYSCIKGTSLSIAEYTLHKIILTALTGIYYLGWFVLSPNSFLR